MSQAEYLKSLMVQSGLAAYGAGLALIIHSPGQLLCLVIAAAMRLQLCSATAFPAVMFFCPHLAAHRASC